MKIRFLIRHVFLRVRSARGGDGGLVKITWQIGDRRDIRRAARVSPLLTVAYDGAVRRGNAIAGARWWPRNVGRALIARSGSGTGRNLWSHRRF